MDGMCDSFSVTDSLSVCCAACATTKKKIDAVTVTHGVMVADSIVFQTGYMLNIFLL